MSLRIYAATDDVFDACGRALVARGLEDSSGARRALAASLACNDFVGSARYLQGSQDDARALRAELVAQFGEPYDEPFAG